VYQGSQNVYQGSQNVSQGSQNNITNTTITSNKITSPNKIIPQKKFPQIIIPKIGQNNINKSNINRGTRPSSANIENNQLHWLSVSYETSRGNIVKGAAKNDDTYEPLKCTWYDNLVRISAIGDGSCFIHAILKAFYKPYQENNNAEYRLGMAEDIRRDLAVELDNENPEYPNHTYWETVGKGSFPSFLMQEIKDEDEIGRGGIDYSLVGLQRLFNSYTALGNEVYEYISDIMNIDIYILRATKDDLYNHIHTRKPGNIRNAIVIIGNKYHYEVLAVNKEEGFQTLFYPGDPFIEALSKLFIGDGGFNDILNPQIYDPDETFINNFIITFTDENGNFQFPDIIYEIFNPDNIFITIVERLKDRIYEKSNLMEQNFLLAKEETQRENDMYIKLNNTLIAMVESDINSQITNPIKIQRKPGNILSLDQIINNLINSNYITKENASIITGLKRKIVDQQPYDAASLSEIVKKLEDDGSISSELANNFYNAFVEDYQ
jgi:hypothetical protein